jgi:hypothetical protein
MIKSGEGTTRYARKGQHHKIERPSWRLGFNRDDLVPVWQEL